MRLFRRKPKPFRKRHSDEIAAICLSRQLEQLALSPHMRADIGLDCGCNDLPVRRTYLP